VLAAGAGSRMGIAKALLREAGVPRTAIVARDLLSAGCDGVTVVLGAAAETARSALADCLEPGIPVEAVVAGEWASGMSGSLRAGLEALLDPARSASSETPAPSAALVMLVDLPDVRVEVLSRVVGRWRSSGGGSDALLRATYAGRPGHPVLLGRDHWPALIEELRGDSGARGYLNRHTVRHVSCEDLATGLDVDRPEDLTSGGAER
jgi:CTP:molybdopterin cytidylyltransferase MocA